MAILTSPAAVAFDNLSTLVGSLASSGSDTASISFVAAGAKQSSTLKLYGNFDAQGNIVSLTSVAYMLPDASAAALAFPAGTDPMTLQASGTFRVDRLLEALLSGDDWFTLGDQADNLNAGAGNDYVNAGGGADRVLGGEGNDFVAGGAGLDTALFSGPRSRYSVASDSGAGFSVTDQTGAEGSDTLNGVERLQFSDAQVALDLDGHAGKVAKLLGAVFGAKAVANREYMGIGLDLLDQGMDYEALAALAVAATGKSAPNDVVGLLWTNVVGSAPTTQQAQPFVDLLEHGTTVGQLTVMAAETAFNATNIDLIGLTKTGIEFVDPA